MSFLAISVPTVTTTLQKTSDSDQSRELREKCQRIIDYVFGNGPFPYSDIKGTNAFYEKDIAQIIAQQKHNTDDEKQTQNKEDETIKIETVVTSEDQPEIISIRKDKEAPSSDSSTKSLDRDEDVHLTVVDYKHAKSSTNDVVTSLHHFEGQSHKVNKIQELDCDHQWKKSITTITPKPFELKLIKPLVTCHHKITDTKCHDKINTSDDEFLYENSCGEEIRKELTKRTNKMAKREITSNVPGYRKNIQDNSGTENEVKAIADVKRNEVKKNSHRITINEFTDDNTENLGHRLIHVTNEKQNNNLKPMMENSAEMQHINTPHVQHKVLSNKTTANVKTSSKTKLNSDKDNVNKTEARKLQNNHNSIGDRGAIEIELFLPTNRLQGSCNLYKLQSNTVNNKINATLNNSDKEDKNERNLLLPLISHGQNDSDKITPKKEPSTDAKEEVLLHCNKNMSTEPMTMEALRIGTKDTVETMNDERQQKYKEHKMDQETKNNGNPLENVVYDPNTYHFDYFSEQLQNRVAVKAVDINNQNSKIKNQNLSEESEKKLVTAHVTPLPHSEQLSQNDKVDNFPIPHATLSELYTSQQYPQQSTWSTSHRQPVQMFSPNNFFIQNRPAIPTSNDNVWKYINPPKIHKQTNEGDKPWKSLELNHAQCLQQQRNPAPSKEEPSSVEHSASPILGPDDASAQQNTVQTHEYNPGNKPGETPKPIILIQPGPDCELEPKLQKSISTENKPLELQSQQEEKHKLDYINHEYEEDATTPLKKPLSQCNTPEKTDNQIQQEKEYETNEQQLNQPIEICSSTKCPIPEFKITNDMPLSELLRVIRLRNQFLIIKDFLESVEMSKCGDKKPDCPPKAPICSQPPPPCPPVQESPPTPPPPPPPCTPIPKKPKPPPKCDCKCKYVAVKGISDVLPRRISERYNIDTSAAVSKPFEQQEQEDVWIDTGSLFAYTFDPWVPIPNYTYPKKKVVISVGCDPRCMPKKIPVYVKPKEKPCTGFPKRLCFSSRTSKNFIVLWNKD